MSIFDMLLTSFHFSEIITFPTLLKKGLQIVITEGIKVL